MATSQHLQIRNAIAALIEADVAVDGGVHKDRDFDLAVGKHKQIHVNFRGTTPAEPADGIVYTGHPRDWLTETELVILTRKTEGVEASDVADALWCEVYALVMADQTLGGLASELAPGRAESLRGEADTSICRFTWSVFARHRTQNHLIT